MTYPGSSPCLNCSMMLGDLGAEIIRVERPGIGDETRHWGPPWAGDQSAYYLCTNRNKKSITVDLKKKEGQEIILQLAKRSDILQEIFLQKTSAEWLQILAEAEVPCGPINTIDRVFADPQVLARGMLVEMEHPAAGKYRVVGSPMKLSETPVRYKTPPPRLGEHTEEVLREILGYEQAQISRLREEKVI